MPTGRLLLAAALLLLAAGCAELSPRSQVPPSSVPRRRILRLCGLQIAGAVQAPRICGPL